MSEDTQKATTSISAGSAGTWPLDIGTLAREHYDAVFRFCARRVGQDRAGDASQETFVTALRVLAKFRGESSVTTWLFGIAHNECRRMIRKERLQPIALDLETNHPTTGESENDIVNRHALRDAMARLSPEHREVVILHELDGLTYEEAAVILGVPPGTVKSRLHHAFIQLRRSLNPEGGAR